MKLAKAADLGFLVHLPSWMFFPFSVPKHLGHLEQRKEAAMAVTTRAMATAKHDERRGITDETHRQDFLYTGSPFPK